MPIYEFECSKCSDKKEILILNHENSKPAKCACGGIYHKLISHSSFVLKGTGWYATDYAKKDKKEKRDFSEVPEKIKSDNNIKPKREVVNASK